MSVIAIQKTAHGPVTGFVYFIAVGHPAPEYVKVGYTKRHPRARLAQLQTGCPVRLTLLGFVPGCVGLERYLHTLLQDDRCEGEWFALSDYVNRVIDFQMEQAA